VTDEEFDAFAEKQKSRARVSDSASLVFACVTMALFVGGLLALGAARYSECRDFGHSVIYCVGGR
jgi:hypothetical protein